MLMIRSLESKFLYSFIVFDCLEQPITVPVYIGTYIQATPTKPLPKHTR